MSQCCRQLLVLYATQTGNAEDVAERIGREARRRHFSARVQSISDFHVIGLVEAPPIIFVTSTTGQGAFPTPMLAFWNFMLKAELPLDLLEGIHYAVFGLGDSSYAKFNWPARKLKRRLDQLGALELCEKGEADDQHSMGIDESLDPWLDNLWASLEKLDPMPSDLQIIPATQRPSPRLNVKVLSSKSHSINGIDTKNHSVAPEGSIMAILTKNERMTSEDHFQDTRELQFSFDRDLDYQPGDVLEICPENLADDVDEFIKIMKWEQMADEAIALSAASQDRPMHADWPQKTTLRHMLTSHLDICSIPKRSFFEMLSYFTTNEDETEKLREFCSPEGQDDMYDYAPRMRRTILETLPEFRSALGNIPLEYLTDLIPSMRPRQFSIASASSVNPRQVDLLVAIVKYKTKMAKPRKGVATSWLAQLPVDTKVPVRFTAGSMRLPEDNTAPIICVGPGTGIAPFRSFVQHRSTLPSSEGATSNLIYFGCRSLSSDFYYREEWEELQEEQKASLRVAASRDGPHDEGRVKTYVQHIIPKDAELIWRYLDKLKGYFYISGSAGSMPKAVRKAVREIIERQGSLDSDSAERYIEDLEKSGRWCEETWS